MIEIRAALRGGKSHRARWSGKATGRKEHPAAAHPSQRGHLAGSEEEDTGGGLERSHGPRSDRIQTL